MKKVLTIIALLFCFIAVFAQKDVTTFLGIPVDGYVPEMRRNLISKGFKAVKVLDQEYFEGEFNGTNVRVHIVTNNNKVYRIMLRDETPRNEANIKIRFNRLVSQFENNKRYVALDNYKIGDEVDISYEMNVNNKRFDAIYYQIPDPEKVDTLALQERMRTELLKKYTEEQLQNPTEEMKNDVQEIIYRIGIEAIANKPVWFTISEDYGDYSITMYYDNEYNHSNGEDL